MDIKKLAIAGVAVAVGVIGAKVFTEKLADKAVEKIETYDSPTDKDIEDAVEETLMETVEGVTEIVATAATTAASIGLGIVIKNIVHSYAPVSTLPLRIIMATTVVVITGLADNELFKRKDKMHKQAMNTFKNGYYSAKRSKENGENRNGKVKFRLI